MVTYPPDLFETKRESKTDPRCVLGLSNQIRLFFTLSFLRCWLRCCPISSLKDALLDTGQVKYLPIHCGVCEENVSGGK